MAVLSSLKIFVQKYPITRGMITYATMWPVSCLIQQTLIEGKNYKNYDYWSAARFSFYGGMCVATSLYGWIRLSSVIWPKNNFKTAITKALVEQVTYGPVGLSMFFFGMTFLEGRGIQKSVDEVKDKFWPSYKVAICVWPVVQTINFTFIKESNRVPFVSMCSMLYTIFLAHMHSLKPEDLIMNQELLLA